MPEGALAWWINRNGDIKQAASLRRLHALHEDIPHARLL